MERHVPISRGRRLGVELLRLLIVCSGLSLLLFALSAPTPTDAPVVRGVRDALGLSAADPFGADASLHTAYASSDDIGVAPLISPYLSSVASRTDALTRAG